MGKQKFIGTCTYCDVKCTKKCIKCGEPICSACALVDKERNRECDWPYDNECLKTFKRKSQNGDK